MNPGHDPELEWTQTTEELTTIEKFLKNLAEDQ